MDLPIGFSALFFLVIGFFSITADKERLTIGLSCGGTTGWMFNVGETLIRNLNTVIH